MAYQLPDLAYAFDALEPHIDAKTMEIHHDKHHAAYVTNLNAALDGTEWMDRPIEAVLSNLEILPADKQAAVRNNGGGHANHSLFWQIMKPGGGGDPSGALGDAIARDFGSLERWRTEFSAMGKAEGGGSGWVILAYSPRDKRLVNQWAADHTTTLAGGRPVMVLDMYEHAYHMDYGAAAAKYVDVFMEAIAWENAVKLYDHYSREG